jgi:hypothetical protein
LLAAANPIKPKVFRKISRRQQTRQRLHGVTFRHPAFASPRMRTLEASWLLLSKIRETTGCV